MKVVHEWKSFVTYISYQCKRHISLQDTLKNLGYKYIGFKEKSKMAEDLIGHPNHYCEGRKFEPKDVIRDWDLNFNLGNAVKYISRNGRKSGESSLKDLKKARQYLDFEIEALEGERDVEDKLLSD